MSWKIGMPNLGHTMEEGKVSEWLKAVGDRVSKGEVIAVVESDKASFDVESPADGYLTHIHVEGGHTVAVGTAIGEVADQMGMAESAAQTPQKPIRISATPVAKKLAQELGIDLLNRIRDELADSIIVEQFPKLEGRQMIMMIAPGRKKPAGKAAEAAPTDPA